MKGDQARRLFRHQLNRRLGHAIARGRLVSLFSTDFGTAHYEHTGPKQGRTTAAAHSGWARLKNRQTTEHLPSLLAACCLLAAIDLRCAQGGRFVGVAVLAGWVAGLQGSCVVLDHLQLLTANSQQSVRAETQ